MSLTLLYRGKNVRFLMKLNKLHWVSASLVFALISGFVIHLLLSSEAQPESPLYTFTDPKAPYDVELKEKSQQVTALTVKLAELQSQVLRLNALGDRLAEEANIPEKDSATKTNGAVGNCCFIFALNSL